MNNYTKQQDVLDVHVQLKIEWKAENTTREIEKRSYTHYIPRKQDKTSELSKCWSLESTPARNEASNNGNDISSKSVKCDKIRGNY